jgi:glycosyltransferase involved in cell wall biosynthesis
VEDLFESLVKQTFRDFEVVVVEDGSSKRCDHIVDRFRNTLSIQYFYKPNTGPGPSRNLGYKHARGEFFVAFDSDCILPPEYFSAVEKFLQIEKLDAWGGPDRAHEVFTPVQRAMGYTMSSFLTTGGIRGGKKHMGWFQPRSFNMGISREVFEKTGGFQFDRYAEDIEFSIRMKQAGFKVGLIPEAFVYHKRRTTFKEFYKQVSNFGKGRALVGSKHPSEVKLTHWFPTFFTFGMFATLLMFFLSKLLFTLGLIFYGFYFLALLIHSFKINKNIWVAFLSIPSAFLQLTGYGTGFLKQHFNK